jgi:hypothetical protein
LNITHDHLRYFALGQIPFAKKEKNNNASVFAEALHYCSVKIVNYFKHEKPNNRLQDWIVAESQESVSDKRKPELRNGGWYWRRGYYQ